MYLAAMGLVLILFTVVIDWLQEGHSSYVGLLLLLFLGMVISGGILTLFGAWRKRRHIGAGLIPEKHLNLNEPADRRLFYFLFFGGAVLLYIAVFMTYTGYRYTESPLCQHSCRL
jgi:hypothetical protein